MVSGIAFLFVLAQQPWDLERCKKLLDEDKAKWGHVCTVEHLERDLADLRKESRFADWPPQQFRESAEHGDAEALSQLDSALAGLEKANAERKLEREKAEAALDPELRGSALLAHCEVFLKMESIESGLEPSPPMPQRDLGQLWNLGQHTGTCMGYVSGVFENMLADMHIVLFSNKMVPVICPPTAVTHQQVIRVVTKFLRDHPERIHQYRLELVAEALKAAFPCPSK